MTYICYQIGISTASKIVREVCLSTWSIMHPECIPKPTKEQWESTALEFEGRANFPHCLWAIDGKHIRVNKPEHSGSILYNYKIFFSVVLMAVADTDYRFMYVDISSYRKDRDSTILSDLRYGHQFRQICWNYTVRDLLQEQNVQLYHTSL